MSFFSAIFDILRLATFCHLSLIGEKSVCRYLSAAFGGFGEPQRRAISIEV